MKIDGKVLITTDWHLGLKGNSVSRLGIIVNVVKELIKTIDSNKIDYLIFGGDLFHSRTAIDTNVINVAIKCIDAISKHCKVLLIVGNHDLYNKNSTEINSINIFKNTDNVIIIDKPLDVSINGNKTLLVPWLTDMSQYGEGTYDFMIGHFDIGSKYLIQSYVEMNKNASRASDADIDNINNNSLINDSSNDVNKSNDMVGDFVLVAKEGGTIFSGHIHNHKEFISKKRKFIFIGSPYEQTLGEINCKCGYYIVDVDNTYKFFSTKTAPKHINVYMSDVVKVGVDKYDFSKLKNNIVHKIYDVDVDKVEDSKICQKILDWKPFEEINPDYDVKIDFNATSNQSAAESIELIKKSKLEYIRNYIDNIDKKVLDDEGIDAAELFAIMKKYYESVTEK